MRKRVEYGGICSTCNSAASCAFSGDPDHPVLECEWFDDYQSPPPKAPDKQRPRLETAVTGEISEEGSDSNKFLGLCKTCNERDTCQFAKPEGGVWHCEEFRQNGK